LDDELKTEIAKDLPDLPFVFISAHNELGLMQLKDMLWLALNPLKP
jgi:GTP-binding protein